MKNPMYLIAVIGAVIISILVLAHSMNRQRQFRDFARNGSIGCFAAGYYLGELSVGDLHVRPGDLLDKETMQELGLNSNKSGESESGSSCLSHIVHITTVRQRLLIDTVTGFVAGAKSTGFPVSNIHFYLEGSEELDIVNDLCERIETRFGITVRVMTTNKFLSHGAEPFGYTLLIGENGRVLFSTDSMSVCELPDYIRMYWSSSSIDSP